jgi:hypothetical protein
LRDYSTDKSAGRVRLEFISALSLPTRASAAVGDEESRG